jgi:hypothetical protein
MAQIDIRNAIVRIKDGYVGPGGTSTINAPAYAAGVSTIVVDNFTGALSNGDRFLIAGDTTIYTVTAHSETLGNTTSITFSPVLAQAVDDNAVITVYQPNADTATVNNGAGYGPGSSVIAVNNFVGAVANGDIVEFAGHATNYTITAHTETLGNTTSITISPVLTNAIVDTEVVTFYQPNVDTLLVNHTGTYAIGTSTIRVTGFSGSVVDGDYFNVGTDTTLYTVVSHVNTLGITTSITFTPSLVVAAPTGTSVVIQPHQIEVTIGDGNLTYDEKRTFKYIRNRGHLDTVRQDQDEPVDVTLDATWEFLRAVTGDPPTIEDALKQRGQASAWISSSSDTCEPYAVDVEVEYDPPCTGEQREIITLNDFRYESFAHDLKMGTLAMKGKANVTEATVVRVA